MPSHHLEDRIRELCAKAIASDDTDLSNVLSELRGAMHEHIENLRRTARQQFARERGHQTQGE